MNISTSECSSGCESGWTTYLDHFSNSTNSYNRQNYKGVGANVFEDQEDEDLSMVSDASSGPPHFLENYDVDPQEDNKKNKQKIKTKETRIKQQDNMCLDDTASSPMLHFSQASRRNNEVKTSSISIKFEISLISSSAVQYSTDHFSQAYSSAYFQEEATPKRNITIFKHPPKGKSGKFLG